MRAPARLFGISLTVFIALTLILSRFESDTVTRTINKFPGIKSQWLARSAAMQSHWSSSSTSASSNAAACDADEKTCAEPYKSHDGSVSKDTKPIADQTTSEYETTESKEMSKDSKDHRPSTKDENRDKDRGFTDAEQAAALERLEFKYGSEAKAGDTKILWMESSTSTTWGADPTAALDPEAQKAHKMLTEEYGDGPTATSTATEDEAEPTEKGWRTTGFETKAKTTHKSLISGGGGNGTVTATGLAEETGLLVEEEEVGTVTSESSSSTKTRKNKWATKTAAAEDTETLVTKTTKGAKAAKATKKPAIDDNEEDLLDDEDMITETLKGAKPTKKLALDIGEDDEEEEDISSATTPKKTSKKPWKDGEAGKDMFSTSKKGPKTGSKPIVWEDEEDEEEDEETTVTELPSKQKKPTKAVADEDSVTATTKAKHQKPIATAGADEPPLASFIRR